MNIPDLEQAFATAQSNVRNAEINDTRLEEEVVGCTNTIGEHHSQVQELNDKIEKLKEERRALNDEIGMLEEHRRKKCEEHEKQTGRSHQLKEQRYEALLAVANAYGFQNAANTPIAEPVQHQPQDGWQKTTENGTETVREVGLQPLSQAPSRTDPSSGGEEDRDSERTSQSTPEAEPDSGLPSWESRHSLYGSEFAAAEAQWDDALRLIFNTNRDEWIALPKAPERPKCIEKAPGDSDHPDAYYLLRCPFGAQGNCKTHAPYEFFSGAHGFYLHCAQSHSHNEVPANIQDFRHKYPKCTRRLNSYQVHDIRRNILKVNVVPCADVKEESPQPPKTPTPDDDKKTDTKRGHPKSPPGGPSGRAASKQTRSSETTEHHRAYSGSNRAWILAETERKQGIKAPLTADRNLLGPVDPGDVRIALPGKCAGGSAKVLEPASSERPMTTIEPSTVGRTTGKEQGKVGARGSGLPVCTKRPMPKLKPPFMRPNGRAVYTTLAV